MLDDELDSLSKQARVAAAATCTERVLDFYRLGNFKLRVRHAPVGALTADPAEDLLEHALKLAWSFVETGVFDEAAVDAVLEGLLADPDDADPEDMCIGGVSVLGCVGGTLRSMTDPTPAEAAKTIEGCASAACDGLAEALDDMTEADRCDDVETAWQPKVLARASQLQARAMSRTDFADLIAEPPVWKKHLAAYAAYYA